LSIQIQPSKIEHTKIQQLPAVLCLLFTSQHSEVSFDILQAHLFHHTPLVKMGLFSGFAMVCQNPQQLILRQAPWRPFFDAVQLAARHPFRGAGFAGLRKASLGDSVGWMWDSP